MIFMNIEIIIPLLFWGFIILLGIILYKNFQKKTKNKKRFEFTGWRKIIYYIGLLNVINLVFWMVMYKYSKKYGHLPDYERSEKCAYVVYYFGYVLITVVSVLLIVNLIFK